MTPQQITEAQRLADSMAASIQAGHNPMAFDAIAAMELLRTLAAQAAQDQRPAAWRVQVDGLWFHARDRDGLIKALGVKLGKTVGENEPEPLYTRPAPAVDVDALMALADDFADAYLWSCNGSSDAPRRTLRAALEGLK